MGRRVGMVFAATALISAAPVKAPTVEELFECRFPNTTKEIVAPPLKREKYSEEMGGDYRLWTYTEVSQKIFGSPVSAASFSRTNDEGGMSFYMTTVLTTADFDDVRYRVEQTGAFKCSLHPNVDREYTCVSVKADDSRSATIAPANGGNNNIGKTEGLVFTCSYMS